MKKYEVRVGTTFVVSAVSEQAAINIVNECFGNQTMRGLICGAIVVERPTELKDNTQPANGAAAQIERLKNERTN